MNRQSYINVSNLSYFILFLSFFTFFYQMANIDKTYFDEFHYVPAAKQWIDMAPITNIEHPPLGKYLIATSIKLFGDNPIGWRASSAISGALTILLCFLISNLIFSDIYISLSVAFFSLFNFWIYVQSRIAMLDIFMVTFFLAGLYYYLKYRIESKNIWSFIFSSCFWGLSVGIKWSALFIYLPFFFTSFYSELDKPYELQKMLKVFLKFIFFGLLSVGTYFFTFIPYMFVSTKIKSSFYYIVFKMPFLMLKMQESVPPNHPYASKWYTWPLMIRPIWYEYLTRFDKDHFQGVVLLGNPIQMVLGIICVFYLLANWLKIKNLSKLALILYLSSWLSWAIAPRKLSFFYYYFPSALFYSFIIPMAIQEAFDKKKSLKIMVIITLISAAFFLYFFPILGGSLTLASNKAKWCWMKSWI